MIEAPI